MNPEPALAKPTRPGRLDCLDVFRGLTMAAMVLVNNPGSWAHVYPPLRHAEWHGCTPTDLIFPFFLFIVGTAMAFSMDGAIEARRSGRALPAGFWGRVVRRTLVLFGLGMLLALYPRFDFGNVRIPGVLQRIALCYLAATVVVVLFKPAWQVALGAALLLGYWALLTLVPVPGVGPATLAPAGNLVQWLDLRLIGKAHLYSQPTDPEGLLSTMPAIVTTLAGFWVGRWMKTRPVERSTSVRLFALGAVCIVVGSAWSMVLPLNKPIWTPSYVVYTAGWAMAVLAVCFHLVEVMGGRSTIAALVFRVFGLNAILLFVGSGLVARTLGLIRVGGGEGGTDAGVGLNRWLYEHALASWLGPLNGSLGYALANIALWWIVLYALYRRRWFLKV